MRLPPLLPLLLPAVALAARVQRRGHSAGAVLRGRYVLSALLHGGGNGTEREPAPFDVAAGGGEGVERRFADARRLAAGGYGEAWRAYDRERRKEVVVKLFFMPASNAYVLGKDSAAAREAERECVLVQRLLRSYSLYPDGRAFICRCLESHVADAADNEPVFVVQDFCGESTLLGLMQQQADTKKDPVKFLRRSRAWMSQVLMALCFLSGLTDPVTHGDLGSLNVVVSAEEDEAKIIDFGLAKQVRGAPDGEKAPWAEDTSAFGQLYARLLCGGLGAGRTALGEAACPDGTMGLGDEADWEVISMALSRLWSPAVLMVRVAARWQDAGTADEPTLGWRGGAPLFSTFTAPPSSPEAD